MFDVDALGRHEAELLREEAARIADTETALKSVLDGDVLVPLVTDRDVPPRRAGTRHPVSVRRRMALLVGVAAGVVAIALVVIRENDATPADQPSPTVTVPLTVPLRALSDAQGELEPGTYFVDEVAGIRTPWISFTIGAGWYSDSQQLDSQESDSQPFGQLMFNSDVGDMAFGRPFTVFSDACHPSDGYHPGPVTTLDGLVTALTEQQGWAKVTEPSDISIDGYAGKAFRRTALADMFDCDRDTVPGNNMHDADFRSWENPDRLGGGGGFYEPGTIEDLWVVDIDGTVVVISTRLWKPTAERLAEFAAVLDSIRIAAWSPELTAQALEPPIACTRSTPPRCPSLEVSPDGTLVALDPAAETLTWYEDEPRVVPLTVELDSSVGLAAIGPHDIAYLWVGPRPSYFVAVAPSGAEISRVDTPNGAPALYPTATGLSASAAASPNGDLLVPWVDLDGNPITDTRPYPTATVTDAGIAVRHEEREWLVAEGDWSDDSGLLIFPRSDGGVVMVLFVYDGGAAPRQVLELSTDGTIERYFVQSWPKVLPDGSLIVEHNRELVRLTPPA